MSFRLSRRLLFLLLFVCRLSRFYIFRCRFGWLVGYYFYYFLSWSKPYFLGRMPRSNFLSHQFRLSPKPKSLSFYIIFLLFFIFLVGENVGTAAVAAALAFGVRLWRQLSAVQCSLSARCRASVFGVGFRALGGFSGGCERWHSRSRRLRWLCGLGFGGRWRECVVRGVLFIFHRFTRLPHKLSIPSPYRQSFFSNIV